MVRLLLLVVLFILVARIFWRFVDNIIEAATGGAEASHPVVPPHGVQMVRDPVCGTFVLPDPTVAIVDGRSRVYFCSTGCRDKYRTRPSTPPGARALRPEPVERPRPEPVEGRTA
jgi:YHS domain-containing protein